MTAAADPSATGTRRESWGHWAVHQFQPWGDGRLFANVGLFAAGGALCAAFAPAAAFSAAGAALQASPTVGTALLQGWSIVAAGAPELGQASLEIVTSGVSTFAEMINSGP